MRVLYDFHVFFCFHGKSYLQDFGGFVEAAKTIKQSRYENSINKGTHQKKFLFISGSLENRGILQMKKRLFIYLDLQQIGYFNETNRKHEKDVFWIFLDFKQLGAHSCNFSNVNMNQITQETKP